MNENASTVFAAHLASLLEALLEFIKDETLRIKSTGDKDLNRELLAQIFKDHKFTPEEFEIEIDAPLEDLLFDLNSLDTELEREIEELNLLGNNRLATSLQQIKRGERGEFPEHWNTN